MDKIKKLVRYISKYGKCTKQFAAKFLLLVFEKNKFFSLPDEKQEIIINNLISYFDTLIISFDKYGQIKDKSNKNISEKEIFKHIELKTFDLVQIKDKLKKY
jgi:hypothetical protein